MVSDGRLMRLRAIAESYLTERCEIEQVQLQVDEYGAIDEMWRVYASNVRCRIIQQRRTGSRVAEIGSQEAMAEEYRLIVPVGIVLRADQRVRVGSAVYTVVSAEDALTDGLNASGTIVRVRE